MPGSNCRIYGCSVSRRSRYKDISIFTVPKIDDDFHNSWRAKFVAAVTRDRVIDASLRRQIENKSIGICQLHFTPDQIIIHRSRKSLVPGSIPTLNMPKKSIPSERSSSADGRQSSCTVIKKLEDAKESNETMLVKKCYKTFDEFVQRSMALKLSPEWSISVLAPESILVLKQEVQFQIKTFEIHVKSNLEFTIRVFGWLLPQNSTIYAQYERSMFNVTLSALIFQLEKCLICPGVFENDLKSLPSFLHHVVPMTYDYTSHANESPIHQKTYIRSPGCLMIVEKEEICTECCILSKKETKLSKRKYECLAVPAKLNAPITVTNPVRVKLALQKQREENKQLHKEISRLQEEISLNSIPVSAELNSDMHAIISQTDKDAVSPFMKLFWDEQQKYINCSRKGIRYHPMLIRYCLNLASKSPATYDDIRYDKEKGTGFLILPSRRRLRDYKNYIRPERGFNSAVIKELCEKTRNFAENEKFMVLSFDEMKVQQDLVWDKHTGDLIGFVDLGDKALNSATLGKTNELASHVLVFMVRSVVNPMKFSLATFATTGSSSFQMFPLLWKAISILELTCGLKVIAVVCDGASANRKLFRMHKLLGGDNSSASVSKVTHKVQNIFNHDPEPRYLHLFADAPHLMKTARNCFSNSGAGKSTRYMWNDGSYILWNHFTKMYNEDKDCGLHLLPKLTEEHVNLNSYSVMNVKLATQVLSSSVAEILSAYGPAEAAGTAKFCSMMDKFFDCLNVRNTTEHRRKLKQFLKPYTTADDSRFDWLINTFLGYFSAWKTSIENRPGDYTEKQKASMFVSLQTYEGLQITCLSLVDCTRYLLNQGVDYVLSERFNQDSLENYFGQQRSLGRRKDNPTVRDFGYNDNSIRNQLAVTPIAGNVGGVKFGQISDLHIIDDTPVPSRKAKKEKHSSF